MNDIKLLYSTETQLSLNKSPEIITFDTKMNRVDVADLDKIYEIDSNDLQTLKTFDLNQENIANSIDNKLVLLQFLTESNNLSLVNSNGDMCLLNVLTKEVKIFIKTN